MKKIYTIVLMIATLAVLIPTLVFADETIIDNEDTYIQSDGNINEIIDIEENNELHDGITSSITKNNLIGKQFQIRGKWGKARNEEIDGYFGGILTIKSTHNNRLYGIFNGKYNKTDENNNGELIGIMKNGYFNGKIISSDGEIKVTGLYRIDRENQLLKMQWMVPFHAGWAVGRINILD